MKKLGLALAAVTALTLAPATAFAKRDGKVDSILFTCNMDFRATGKSIYVGLGWSNIKGKGSISCYDLVHGTTEILPVKVRVKGPGAGLGVTGLVLSGAVAGVGVERGPQDLIGRYVAIRGSAAVGVGVGGSIGLRISKGGITIPVSVQGLAGLGAGLDLLSVKIESDGDSRIEPGQPPVAHPNPNPQPLPRTAPPQPEPQAAPAASASAEATAEADEEGAEASAAADAEANGTSAGAGASAGTLSGATSGAASAGSAAAAASNASGAQAAASAKANVVYVQEGQPLQILDAKGRVIQTIYLKQK